MMIQEKQVTLEQLREHKDVEFGRVLEAISCDPRVLWKLQIDGPSTIKEGFFNREYGFDDEEALLLQELAQECYTPRDLAAKFLGKEI